jgi:hypothetical protein
MGITNENTGLALLNVGLLESCLKNWSQINSSYFNFVTTESGQMPEIQPGAPYGYLKTCISLEPVLTLVDTTNGWMTAVNHAWVVIGYDDDALGGQGLHGRWGHLAL